jgi:hypothetical protein
MTDNYEWRFPANNFDVEKGLDTADMETFKKDPISSLAREICQNSIDARRDKDLPVRVEFALFSVDSNQIPGLYRLKQEIESCQKYWSHSETISNELNQMHRSISRNRISCLRISDFNTTGLVGVSDSLSHDKPWYLLTKGSGISLKEGATGGSKGIGKFSTFVASSFNTVFYATKTEEGEEGFQGIAKFASTHSRTNSEEKTSGNGYYSSNEKNQPILEPFSLDKMFNRNDDDYGTDVYILGFDYFNWESSVITKVLESFMVAIVRGHLEVIVNKQEIKSSTLERIIDKKIYIRQKEYNSIQSQFELLTSPNVFSQVFDYEGYGKFELKIKGYNHQEVYKAVNNCLMVRYPYMKIKSFENLTHIPHSAICIIGDNELNQTLRRIENPQHTDWEINRIKDYDQKRIVKKILSDLRTLISQKIREYLLESDHKQSDIEGASEHLPDSGEDQEGKGEEISRTHTSRLKGNDRQLPIGQSESEQNLGLEPDIGEIDDDGDDKHYSEDGKGKSFEDKPIVEGAKESGEKTIFKTSKLEGIHHKFFIFNKESKIYKLNITSPLDEEECVICIYALDDMNNRSKVDFVNVESESTFVLKNGNIHLKFEKGTKYSFVFQTDFTEKFSAEVIFYAVK